MKVCSIARGGFFEVLGAIFKATNVHPDIAELGVLRGENAMKMYRAMSPRNLVLVDSWSVKRMDEYRQFATLPPWISPMSRYNFYFGGNIDDQATFEKLYQECKQRFDGFANVTLVREDTVDAVDKIRSLPWFEKFDVVYVDSNHQYEYVLRDLLYYNDLVKENGVFIVKNCCHSADSIKQNVGALEATGNFMKRTDFVPVAMTHTDWTEVMLVRRGKLMERAVDELISNANIFYVDVPSQLMPAMRVVDGPKDRKNISFL